MTAWSNSTEDPTFERTLVTERASFNLFVGPVLDTGRVPMWAACVQCDEITSYPETDYYRERLEKHGCLNLLGTRWEMRLLSYQGIVAWASHWQCHLEGPMADVVVAWIPDEAGRLALSTRDFKWTAGDWSERFIAEQDARSAGLFVFSQLATEHDVLTDHFEGLDVIAGTRMDEVNAALSKFSDESIERYKWMDKQFRDPIHASLSGPGIPKPRHEEIFIVKREGSGWATHEHHIGNRWDI